MEYFESFSQHDLRDLIRSTQRALYLSLPSIHDELETEITLLDFSKSLENKNVEIHILVDFDSQTFRQGYGNFKSVEDLWQGGFDIKSLRDNRISFIISDDVGYYLFIESRTMIPADKATINAIRIDPVSQVRLKKFFFSAGTEKTFEDELTNAIIEESLLLKQAGELIDRNTAPVHLISDEEVNEVCKDLYANPPLNPDFTRLVEIYKNKFQYVKLKFEGANLQHRKIEIPSKALPIADANLKKRLETKLNLFDPDKVEQSFSALQNFKEQVAEIREKYLTKVRSRDESLLNMLKKMDFQDAIKSLEKKITDTKQKTLNNIAAQIKDTKDRLLVDLADFFEANPKALVPNNPELWQENSDYLRTAAVTKAEEIIHRIRWPMAHILVGEFKLIVQYSNITFEDLKSEEFVEELKTCGLIDSADKNQLAVFSKGIETK